MSTYHYPPQLPSIPHQSNIINPAVIFAKIFDKKRALSNNRRYVQNSYCLYSSGYDLYEELMNLNNTKDVNLISFTFMYQNDTFVKEDRKSSVDLFHIR